MYMASGFRWFAIILLCAGLAGCGNAPKTAYAGFYRALEKGEMDHAADYFSSSVHGVFGRAKLRMVLEKVGHDFPVVTAAERLEERYADLAACVAEKLKAMRP